ncbi:hypothetical protein KIW84_011338, partial [Lathyrus oleraceus]
FTKSAYEAMTVCFEKDDSAEGLYSACNISWRLKILFRIKAFEWRTFFNRLPTKDQLNKRGIITDFKNLCCVFCSNEVEILDHPLIFDEFSKIVRRKVEAWLGRRLWQGDSVRKSFGLCCNSYLLKIYISLLLPFCY